MNSKSENQLRDQISPRIEETSRLITYAKSIIMCHSIYFHIVRISHGIHLYIFAGFFLTNCIKRKGINFWLMVTFSPRE